MGTPPETNQFEIAAWHRGWVEINGDSLYLIPFPPPLRLCGFWTCPVIVLVIGCVCPAACSVSAIRANVQRSE